MATISTHTLNAVDGSHAGGVAVRLEKISSDGTRQTLFETRTDAGGRMSKEIEPETLDPNVAYELVIGAGAFFSGTVPTGRGEPMCRDIIFRFSMRDTSARYHIPFILSPYGYSVWWSRP